MNGINQDYHLNHSSNRNPYGENYKLTKAEQRVNRAIEAAKRILINTKVHSFSSDAVAATAALILQEEQRDNHSK